MTHLYKMTEWQSAGGAWYCNDVEDLGNGSGRWWIPARMLGLPPVEFVKLLVEEFKVDNISYNIEKDVLVYSWRSQAAMRRFKNWTNAMARKCNFQI